VTSSIVNTFKRPSLLEGGNPNEIYDWHEWDPDCERFGCTEPLKKDAGRGNTVAEGSDTTGKDDVPELLPRASALREAEKLTCGDRNNDYGPPTQDFQRTADLLNALGYRRIDAADTILDILPSDVALIVAQVKVSRLMHSRGKRDSWVDLAGYAGCGYECAQEEAK
jgi:hypothetical protein